MTTDYNHKNGAGRMLSQWLREGGLGSADGNTFTFLDADGDVIAVWKAGGPRHVRLNVPDAQGVLKPRRGDLSDLGALLKTNSPAPRQGAMPLDPDERIKALEEALDAARAVREASEAVASAQRALTDALRRQTAADASLSAAR